MNEAVWDAVVVPEAVIDAVCEEVTVALWVAVKEAEAVPVWLGVPLPVGVCVVVVDGVPVAEAV